MFHVRNFEQVLGEIGDYCAGWKKYEHRLSKLASLIVTERIQLDLPSKGTCQMMPLSKIQQFILDLFFLSVVILTFPSQLIILISSQTELSRILQC